MTNLSTESTPRERLARTLTLLKRTRLFWRSAAAIALFGLGLSLVLALRSKRAWRSETTVLYRDTLPTTAGESATARALRLGPKLKDLLYARPELEEIIREYDLFPAKTARSMVEGVEEMQSAVAFRVRAGDSYVISFTYEDPDVAKSVTERLAERMIAQYDRQSLDTATLTRNFLRRRLDEANKQVGEASRALSVFLSQHPQFQWGVNDSPYAPVPAGAPILPGKPALARIAGPSDPVLAFLERELTRVEGELFPGVAGVAGAGGGLLGAPTSFDAHKARDAAAAALAAAQSTLAEKLQTVTSAHPDAISARARVDAARQALAGAESALRQTRVGAAAPSGSGGAELSPARRADLEQQRSSLRRRIGEHRARPSIGEAPRPRSGPDKSAANEVVELETEWHRLRLDLDRARDEVRTLETSARAADLSADAVEKQGREEMKILEPAYRPTRPDRGRGRVFFIGAAITFFLALGYAAARVLLNDTLLDEGDLAALGGPALLVSMPRLAANAGPTAERAIVPVPPPDPPSDRPASPGFHTTPPPEPPPAPVLPPLAFPIRERDRMITIPFGMPLPPRDELPTLPDEVLAAHEEAPTRHELALRAERTRLQRWGGRSADDPEVEVIGTGVDPVGPAGSSFLRDASPAALAALRVLRHRLEQRRGDGALVVSVMSPGAGEGKTTLAALLALTLSEAERARVVLVDGNFDRPRVAAALGLRLPDEAGFSAQIQRRMAGRGVPWGVVRLGPSLSVLAEPGPEASCATALHSTHFEAAIATLRRSHDYTVIDGPAVLGSGNANVIEAVSDGVVLVVRAATTRGTALSRALAQIGDRRMLGVVLNGV